MELKEDAEQKHFFKWMQMQYPEWHESAFHVPNGGYRNVQEAAKFKALGVKCGVSDIIILRPSGEYHGFICELKRAGKSFRRPTQPQADFLALAKKHGYKTCVAAGFEEAKNYLEDYINGN